MKYTTIGLIALLVASPVIAKDRAIELTLENVKAASLQAFMMANSARVWAEATGNATCMRTAHEAMTGAGDAALFAIKADDATDVSSADKHIRHGMFQARRSVRLSASCLPANYKERAKTVIPYELPVGEQVEAVQ